MNDDALIAAISRLWRPGNFCVGRSLRCAWQFETTQAIPWETFRGRLVEDRRAPPRPFLAWNLLPVVDGPGRRRSADLRPRRRTARSTSRGYLIYAHEADASLETLEVQRWTRELVGNDLRSAITTRTSLLAEIRTLIRHAVVGTSRLPLTSVEAPHPAFTLGQARLRARLPRLPAIARCGTRSELVRRPPRSTQRRWRRRLRAVAPGRGRGRGPRPCMRWLGDVGRVAGPLAANVQRRLAFSLHRLRRQCPLADREAADARGGGRSCSAICSGN